MVHLKTQITRTAARDGGFSHEKGLSEQSKQLRRYPLNHNTLYVMNWMQGSGMGDPAGMIVEMTADISRQLPQAALVKQGKPRRKIPELFP